MKVENIIFNKKGFTLVELIATIIILGAITLITTPIVLNTIKKSKTEAFIRSCEAVEKGAEAYVNSELGGIVENDMIIPTTEIASYVSNINITGGYVLVKISKDGTINYYYTGREKNPNEDLVLLKDKIESSKIEKNVQVNGVTVNKVYGTKADKELMRNYVWFSGHLWQVVETNNAQGTIKLVTAESVTTIAYGPTNNWNNSWVRKWLNNEFYENLDRKDIVKDTIFCIDTNDTLPENYTKMTNCTNTITEKIGLLTYEDYIYAKDGKTIQDGDSFLSERGYWFITSPTQNLYQWHTSTETHSHAIITEESSNENWNDVNGFGYGVRPVISIKDDVLIKSGIGTKSDPYILTTELTAKTNSLILNAKVGNYVYLDESNNPYSSSIEEILLSGVKETVSTDKVRYRIVKINDDGSVKLIRASILTGLPSDIAYSGKHIPFTNTTQTNSSYSVTGTYTFSLDYADGRLGVYLNNATNSFYNWYSSKAKSMIKFAQWNLYTSGRSKDYSNLNDSTSTTYPNRTNDGTIIAKVGLPTWGEMFSASNSGYGFWLINRRQGSSNIGTASVNGMGSITNPTYEKVSVRPSVVLKAETYITGGSGTMNDPYTLEIDTNLTSDFETDSWSTIIKNVKSGNTKNYNVGEIKQITLKSTDTNIAGTYRVRIANTSTPAECNTTGFSQTACGFVIEFVDIINEHAMNSTRTNVGGWRDSEMRTYVNDNIYNSLPTEVKNGIIDTTVVSGHGSTSGEANFTTTDKLYLLSTKEVFGTNATYDTAGTETRQLDYYKNILVSNGLGRIKTFNGSNSYWWLRTAENHRTDSFDYLYDGSDDLLDFSADSGSGVAPAFRIG